MEYHKTINEILKLLDTQIEIVKVGDLLETYKTQFIIKKNNSISSIRNLLNNYTLIKLFIFEPYTN